MRNTGKVLLLLAVASTVAVTLASCSGSSSAPTSQSSRAPVPLAAGLGGADNQILSETVSGSLSGATVNAYFGFSVASGDFDGDGIMDLAVGIPFDNNERGTVNVFRGSDTGISESDVQKWTKGASGIGGTDVPGDRFGYSLVAGDFNGDNVADLAIGVPGDNTAGVHAGSSIVLYGSKGTGLVSFGSQLWSQGIGGVPGAAGAGDLFGASLAAGDFNGDNVADLAIGVPGDNTAGVHAGSSIVLYGSKGTGLVSFGSQLWSRKSNSNLGNPAEGDRFGQSLSAGDFDGNGYDDLAIGVPGANVGDTAGAGAVIVFYGTETGLSTLRNQLWDQNGLDNSGGAEAGDAFGSALAAGDFNGDGVADLAIGVPGEDIVAVVNAGSVNVLYGRVNHPPVANAGIDQTVAVDNQCLATVPLDGSGSFDPDGNPLTYTWNWSGGSASGPTPEIVLTLGTYTITLTVEDGFGGIATDNVVVTVVDRTPPVILEIKANPEILWPPNHKFVPVTFTVRAKDNCDANPVPQLVSISSNEPVNDIGDGNTSPDWVVMSSLTANIRAERSGTGSGRVYTATISVTDFSGNVAKGTEEVLVPHDQR
jgi:hypothetical protein